MLEKILSGEKTVTRRRHGRISRHEGARLPVRAGRVGEPEGHIRIVSIRSVRLTDFMSEDEARREGFVSPSAFREWWLDRFGADSWRGRVERVEFRLIHEVPLVCPYCEEIALADEWGVFNDGDLFDCSSCGERLSATDFPTYVKTPE